MITFTQLIIFGMATWRIASMFVSEAGPFHIFTRIRMAVGIVHDEGTPVQYPDRFFPQLLSCVWCSSIWIGFGWLSFFLLSPELATKIAAAFSFSTAAIMIDKYLKRT